MAAVVAALASVVLGNLGSDMHVADIARRMLRVPFRPCSFVSLPNEVQAADVAGLRRTVLAHAALSQVHIRHVARCRQGEAGKTGCASCLPCGHPTPQLLLQLLPDSEDGVDGDVPLKADAWLCRDCGNSKLMSGLKPSGKQREGFRVIMPRRGGMRSICGLQPGLDVGARFPEFVPPPDDRIMAFEVPRSDVDVPEEVLALPEDASEADCLACVKRVLCLPGVRASLVSMGVAVGVDAALGKLSGAYAVKIVGAWRFGMRCRESSVTPVSVGLTAAVRCNTAPLVLGSDVCAKAALFYLVKYMTKDSAEMNASLSVLADARRHMDKYPSTAEDSGSGSRNVKHFIQRALQRMDMELADTQAASCAMGEMADFWTDMFVRLHLHATMQGAVRLSRGLSILGSVDDDGDGSVSASDVCESDPSLPSDGDDCDADEADMLLAGCSGRLDCRSLRNIAFA